MQNDFKEVMSERTDKQLVDIVTLKRNEYQPEAIKAAEQEIELRKLDVYAFYTQEEIEASQQVLPVDKVNVPFEWYHKVLTVLFPIITGFVITYLFKAMDMPRVFQSLGFPLLVLAHFAVYRGFKDNGYVRMAREFLRWIVYTLYVYIGIGLICILLVLAGMLLL